MAASARRRSRAGERLDVIASRVDALLDAAEWNEAGSRERVREALESSLDALSAVAAEIGLADPASRRALATRDLIDSHLRAAADAEAAGVRPQVVGDLLARAQARLIARDDVA